MRDRDRLVQVSDETATLVLSGTVSAQRRQLDAPRLLVRSQARIRTLRLNFGAVEEMDARVMDAVRGVVRDWRASRDGDFRLDLTTPHLVARIEEERRPSP